MRSLISNSELLTEYEEMQETERVEIKYRSDCLMENNETELILLCLNCQNYIEICKIDQHSVVCTQLTDSVRSLDRQSAIDQIKYKIIKLTRHFDKALDEGKLKDLELTDLAKIQNLAFKVTMQDQFVCDQFTVEKLLQVLKQIKCDSWIKLLGERFYMLMKQLQMACEAEPAPFELQVIKYDKEICELKERVNVYKRRSLILKNICSKTQPKGRISQLIENIDSATSSPQRIQTSISSTSPEPHSPDHQHQKFSSQSDLRKYFYSLYLSTKLHLLSQKLKPVNFSINKLYTHALFKRIPPESWQDFIISQFNSPNIDFINAPKSRLNKYKVKQSFESIIEEESATDLNSKDT